MKRLIKFWLVSLLSLIWFVGFWYCSYNIYNSSTSYVQAWETKDFPSWGMNCLLFKSSSCLNNAELLDSNWNLITWMAISQMLCFDWTWQYTNNYTSRCTVDTWSISSSCPTCPTCPSQYTSEECQTEYWLVSSWVLNECISDLDNCQSSITWYNNSLTSCSNNLNNCTTNLNNCLVANCGEVQWSALYINQIQHVSAPIINIDIPEEYNRTYTWDENSFDLTVEWYNVDYEYIDNIITTQKTTPNSVDFNNIVSGLIPLLIPWLAIILLLWFIFRFIKKIF